MCKDKSDLKNIINGDFHVHSLFSDGIHTFDELTIAAEKLGLNTIAICDHSDEYMNFYGAPRLQGFYHALHRWKNTLNSVNVIRGLELDLISDNGDISDLSRYKHLPAFLILSAHKGVYGGSSRKITDAYLRAIDKYSDKICILGHPCSTYFGSDYDDGVNIEKIVSYANDANIGIEVNGANLVNGKSNIEKLKYVCQKTNLLYVNSDGHTIFEMDECRKTALNFAAKYSQLYETVT